MLNACNHLWEVMRSHPSQCPSQCVAGSKTLRLPRYTHTRNFTGIAFRMRHIPRGKYRSLIRKRLRAPRLGQTVLPSYRSPIVPRVMHNMDGIFLTYTPVYSTLLHQNAHNPFYTPFLDKLLTLLRSLTRTGSGTSQGVHTELAPIPELTCKRTFSGHSSCTHAYVYTLTSNSTQCLPLLAKCC